MNIAGLIEMLDGEAGGDGKRDPIKLMNPKMR